MSELKNNLFEHIEEEPREHYTFQFTPEELAPVEKKYVGRMRSALFLSVVIDILLIVWNVLLEGAKLSFAFGVWFVITLVLLRGVLMYKKAWRKSNERYGNTLFDYTLYDDFLIVWVSSEDAIRQMKVKWSDIKRVQSIEGLVVMEIEGKLYLVRKHELGDDSRFHALANRK